MATPYKLTEEQKSLLLEWLAAEYHGGLIRVWCKERGWVEPSDQLLNYYRNEWKREITAARKKRRNSALNKGLAVKEERVAQLVELADELKAILWVEDLQGKLPNVATWLKTLDDIAKEVGGRVNKTEMSGALDQNGTMRVVVEYAENARDPEHEEVTEISDAEMFDQDNFEPDIARSAE